MGDDASRNLLPYSSNDFVNLPSFVEQVDDFDPLCDLISGTIDYPSLDCGFVAGTNTVSSRGDMFHVNDDGHPNSLPMDGFLNQLLDEGGEDEDDDDNHSSSSATTATLSTPTTKKAGKVDRSKTLISERSRRGRMKEKLYALRSLVPNITKMDKASIVGDAVLYVQDLQTQAKKLKAEIAGLEASLSGAKRQHQVAAEEEEDGQPPENNNRPNKRTQHLPANPKHISRKILQMDVFQVEEGGFYTRLVCCRGVGVAVSLYKALETLTAVNIHTSNLASASPDRFVLTFNLTIKEGEEAIMNLASIKLWITGALLTQGFEFGNISSLN